MYALFPYARNLVLPRSTLFLCVAFTFCFALWCLLQVALQCKVYTRLQQQFFPFHRTPLQEYSSPLLQVSSLICTVLSLSTRVPTQARRELVPREVFSSCSLTVPPFEASLCLAVRPCEPIRLHDTTEISFVRENLNILSWNVQMRKCCWTKKVNGTGSTMATSGIYSCFLGGGANTLMMKIFL